MEIQHFERVWAEDTNLAVTNICMKVETMDMNKITVGHLEERKSPRIQGLNGGKQYKWTRRQEEIQEKVM